MVKHDYMCDFLNCALRLSAVPFGMVISAKSIVIVLVVQVGRGGAAGGAAAWLAALVGL